MNESEGTESELEEEYVVGVEEAEDALFASKEPADIVLFSPHEGQLTSRRRLSTARSVDSSSEYSRPHPQINVLHIFKDSFISATFSRLS